MGRGDLTNEQWARLEPLLPKGKKSGRPPTWSKRQLIDGIRWRTRTGAPWRDVPARYGPWQTVYGLFRRWQRDGTWQRILTGLQAQADAKGLITWEVSVDSTIARAHTRHPNTVQHRPKLRAVTTLAGGDHDRQRPLATLDRQVQLATQPTPRAPERVVGGLDVDSAWFFALPVPPLRAPAAC